MFTEPAFPDCVLDEQKENIPVVLEECKTVDILFI